MNNVSFIFSATLFGGIFIRDIQHNKNRPQTNAARSKANQQVIDRKKASFVYHFLVNDQSDLITNM